MENLQRINNATRGFLGPAYDRKIGEYYDLLRGIIKQHDCGMEEAIELAQEIIPNPVGKTVVKAAAYDLMVVAN